MRFLRHRGAMIAALGATLILALSGPAALAQSAPATPPAAPAEQPKTEAPAPQPEESAATTEAGAPEATGEAREDIAPPPGAYQDVFNALFIALVLAVVLESALAVIFNWRPFLLYFDGRGVRTLISVGIALSLAYALKFDLVGRLYVAAQADTVSQDLGFLGKFITALILGGGSAAVNTIFRGLGLRQIGTRDDVVAKPPPTMAWIAVSLNRKNAVGPVEVSVTDASGVATLVGMINGNSHPPGLLRWLIRDEMRYPTAGGHAVLGNADYSVSIAGKDRSGQPLTDSWGPFHIGAGAIVDLTLTA